MSIIAWIVLGLAAGLIANMLIPVPLAPATGGPAAGAASSVFSCSHRRVCAWLGSDN
jgi:hypothetical protein